ncbi:TonB-dependent receptor plug domain-containing protein [Pelotalea chapellei]|uniref:TonB-dependent receptor n=1 Tax=Pelotalea chapellei TaxID=44671 RepID=A0ABS5UBZ5_9BACT|nr:TonB-dependent receptor [Pelotalea chapellei]MBT1073006.1 TonB-dependent receptor [Pelotalea chapellei]
MKKTSLFPYIFLVGCLSVSSPIWGADESLSQPDLQTSENSTTQNKELLLFFEEQDLVTATKRATSLRKAPAIATIITADEIRNMGARNLLDVLKMVPGIGISINEYGVTMIEVRGVRSSTSEKILVMINGHSLNKNFTGSAFYSYAEMLPTENIRQVEVVRGPGSALYGNSAFVATINIITRNAEEINGLELNAGGGSFGSFKGNLLGGKAIGDKLTLSGSLDHYQTNGHKRIVESDYLSGNPSSFPFPTASLSTAPNTPDLSLKQTDAFLKIGYGDLSFRGGYRTVRKGAFVGLGFALTDNSYQDIDTYWSELAYGLNLSETFSTNIKLYYDLYEQVPNVKILPNGFLGFPNGMIGRPLVKDRTIGAELQVDWEAFTGNHLIGGFSFEDMQQYGVRQLGNFNPLTGVPLGSIQEVATWNKNANRQIYAFYLQDEWQLLERLNLTTGLRYDHYSDFGSTVNPRIGLVWSFLENADLKILYGQAFRAPNFQELYNINNPAQLGNSKLKPEHIETIETGIGWRLNRSFAANLNYFYSTIKDQIDVDPSTTPTPTYANFRKSKTQGIELGLNGAYGPDLYWKMNYAFQDPRDADSERKLAYVPSHRASGSINYAPVKYVNLHTDVLWTGPRPRSNGDSRPEMPAYTTVDLAVTLKNFYKTLEIQGTVRNLFDEHYKDPDTSGALNKVPGDFPREGISGFVTASYRF